MVGKENTFDTEQQARVAAQSISAIDNDHSYQVLLVHKGEPKAFYKVTSRGQLKLWETYVTAYKDGEERPV